MMKITNNINSQILLITRVAPFLNTFYDILFPFRSCCCAPVLTILSLRKSFRPSRTFDVYINTFRVSKDSLFPY